MCSAFLCWPSWFWLDSSGVIDHLYLIYSIFVDQVTFFEQSNIAAPISTANDEKVMLFFLICKKVCFTNANHLFIILGRIFFRLECVICAQVLYILHTTHFKVNDLESVFFCLTIASFSSNSKWNCWNAVSEQMRSVRRNEFLRKIDTILGKFRKSTVVHRWKRINGESAVKWFNNKQMLDVSQQMIACDHRQSPPS